MATKPVKKVAGARAQKKRQQLKKVKAAKKKGTGIGREGRQVKLVDPRLKSDRRNKKLKAKRGKKRTLSLSS